MYTHPGIFHPQIIKNFICSYLVLSILIKETKPYGILLISSIHLSHLPVPFSLVIPPQPKERWL